MKKIKNVCVYCGSSAAVDNLYKNTARDLGQRLAHDGMTLVYGGGASGLMGMTADATLAAGGKVIGIFPEFLGRFETPHKGLTEIFIVDSMHSRKEKMAQLSDCFVVLPGGFGTLDEFFEILTWRQLELHDKPVFLVNIEGYWDPLLTMIGRIFDRKFAREHHRGCFAVINSIDELCAALSQTEGGETAKIHRT
jgi:uncharacterized protein (TIGR00730 family)